MLIQKLQENKDKDTEAAQNITAYAIVMLKKRSIPGRIKMLLRILDKCEMVIEKNSDLETAKLTTAGSLLSYFEDEIQALREASHIFGYSKKDDPIVIREACSIYRIKKQKSKK